MVQYWLWLGGLVRLDFGRSFTPDGRPVLRMIGERLPVTLLLNVVEMLIIVATAVPIGALSATRQYSTFDKVTTDLRLRRLRHPRLLAGPAADDPVRRAARLAAHLGPALPELGVPVLLDQQWDFLSHLTLPIVVATFGGLAGFSRYMRQSMLEVIRQDYIQSARAKGLAERVVIGKHALRNAMLPIVTILGLSLPALIGGSVIVESVFAIPGHGAAHGAGGLPARLPGDHGQPGHRVRVDPGGQPGRRSPTAWSIRGPGWPGGGTAVRAFGRAFVKNRLAVIGGVVGLHAGVLATLSPRPGAARPPPPQHQVDPRSALGRHAGHRPARPRRPVAHALRRARCRWRSASSRLASPPPSASHWAPPPATRGADRRDDHAARRSDAGVPPVLPAPRRAGLSQAFHLDHHGGHRAHRMDGRGATGPRRISEPLKEREFVVWSQSVGASGFRVIWWHILPNAMAPGAGGHDAGDSRGDPHRVGAVVARTRRATSVASWGNILNEGKDTIEIAWWLSLYPAWPSSSRCSPTTCSAKASVTRSIHDYASAWVALSCGSDSCILTPRPSRRCARLGRSSCARRCSSPRSS